MPKHHMSDMWCTHSVRRVWISRNPNGTIDVFLKTLRGKVVDNKLVRHPRGNTYV